MKVIITNFFIKNFEKVAKDIDINFLINKINTNSINFINLKTPFFKLKIKSNNKTYRLIIYFEKDLLKILLINIYDKKDKQIGENINRNLHKNLIIDLYQKNLNDIQNGDYKTFLINN